MQKEVANPFLVVQVRQTSWYVFPKIVVTVKGPSIGSPGRVVVLHQAAIEEPTLNIINAMHSFMSPASFN